VAAYANETESNSVPIDTMSVVTATSRATKKMRTAPTANIPIKSVSSTLINLNNTRHSMLLEREHAHVHAYIVTYKRRLLSMLFMSSREKNSFTRACVNEFSVIRRDWAPSGRDTDSPK